MHGWEFFYNRNTRVGFWCLLKVHNTYIIIALCWYSIRPNHNNNNNDNNKNIIWKTCMSIQCISR